MANFYPSETEKHASLIINFLMVCKKLNICIKYHLVSDFKDQMILVKPLVDSIRKRTLDRNCVFHNFPQRVFNIHDIIQKKSFSI